MFFYINFFYPSERGQDFIHVVWTFPNSRQAEIHARKYADEVMGNCTKIQITWNTGTEQKTRTLRKDENGKFKRGRK